MALRIKGNKATTQPVTNYDGEGRWQPGSRIGVLVGAETFSDLPQVGLGASKRNLWLARAQERMLGMYPELAQLPPPRIEIIKDQRAFGYTVIVTCERLDDEPEPDRERRPTMYANHTSAPSCVYCPRNPLGPRHAAKGQDDVRRRAAGVDVV